MTGIRIPELTNHQRDLLTMGLCPFCEAPIRSYRSPEGSFAPEAWATLREHNINPSTGHKADCRHQQIVIRNGK